MVVTQKLPLKKNTVEHYVFNNVETQREWERLRLIERVFDPLSRKWLRRAGVGPGRRCLEVGPGAGSLARWMVKVCGPKGQVTAVDLNPRFLTPPQPFNLVKGDILNVPLKRDSLDVVHTRYVLVHLREVSRVLNKLLDALKPGGWMILEEPDFSLARPLNGTRAEQQAVGRVNQAILAMFTQKKLDPQLGTQLPVLAMGQGLGDFHVEMDTPLSRGGEEVAEVMARSAEQLSAHYTATGLASKADVKTYVDFCRNPDCWALYYATLRLALRKAI